MNTKIRFNWIAALAAAIALTFTSSAAQRITNNENVTNKTTRAAASASHDSKSTKVNINTASKSELESLPGVGPAIADNIISARPFKSVRDLKDVSGIGEQRFQEILPHVTVGSAASRRSSSATASGGPSESSSARASGSDKPTAKAQSENVTPPGSKNAGGVGGAVTTDSVHSGSDKPGARAKEESRVNRSSANTTAKVNLNTASKEELEALPGIGPVKAQAIIDNRPYSKPEDVMKVSGIKEGTYDRIRDQITVR